MCSITTGNRIAPRAVHSDVEQARRRLDDLDQPEPQPAPTAAVRRIVDDVDQRVRALLADLDVPVVSER